jgi:transmembrane sensor
MTERDEDVLRAALEAAAAWRLILTEAGQETLPAFEVWVAASSAHGDAWRRVKCAWAAMEGVAAATEIAQARRRALMRAPRRSSGRRLLAAAAAFVLAVSTSFSGVGFLWSGDVVSTPQGERRTSRLDDGSWVTLDAGTVIRVRLYAHRRDVELVRGQARFDVAPDPERPFRVRAGGQNITALGTIFTVDRGSDSVEVTLLEGRVAVAAGRSIAQGGERIVTLLAPGQRLEAVLDHPAAPSRVRPVTLAQATAWESGRLVFDSEPLVHVAERVSRYSPYQIVATDPAVAGLRVSGVFNAGDADTFIEAVSAYFHVQAERRLDGSIILKGADEKSPPPRVGNLEGRRLTP